MKVVFDTNVVVSATFWAGVPFDCLSLWAQGHCQAAVSPALLAEYLETTERLRPSYPDRDATEWAQALAESATLVFPHKRAAGVTKDAADEMVLECAWEAQADYIVTGDKKHLLPLLNFEGSAIIGPKDFLSRVESEGRK